LPADKAIALGVIEPLDCSLFCHVDTVFLSINLRWRDSEVRLGRCWLIRRELLTTDSV
jgi:hypothetical protein